MKVNSISNLAGVRHAVLRAKFDDDHSVNVYGFKDRNHIIQFDYRATFTNIVLRSNSVLTIEVLQGFELAVWGLGKARNSIVVLKILFFNLGLDPDFHVETWCGESRDSSQILEQGGRYDECHDRVSMVEGDH